MPCPCSRRGKDHLWGGHLSTLDSVLGGDVARIVEYLRRVGRTDPPVYAVTPTPPPPANPHDVKMMKKKKKV